MSEAAAEHRAHGPLAGRRIVVTRAPEQAAEFAQRLKKAGATALFLPTVQFLDPLDMTVLDRAIRSLAEFDWLVLTSVNAARFFLRRCRQLDGSWPEGQPKIAAVGAATSAAVEAEGRRAELVPPESTGSGLAAALASKISGRKVLLPRSDLASRQLPEALQSAGALVTEVVVYRTGEPDGLHSSVRAALLAGDADAITFFSPSAFRHLANVLGESDLRAAAARTAFAAVGPVTASAIRDAGFRVAVEAAEAGSEAMVAALERYFAADLASETRKEKG